MDFVVSGLESALHSSACGCVVCVCVCVWLVDESCIPSSLHILALPKLPGFLPAVAARSA